ncbi:MAG: hypothetical protein ACXW32_05945 [Limisphaerales bacterium]
MNSTFNAPHRREIISPGTPSTNYIFDPGVGDTGLWAAAFTSKPQFVKLLLLRKGVLARKRISTTFAPTRTISFNCWAAIPNANGIPPRNLGLIGTIYPG